MRPILESFGIAVASALVALAACREPGAPSLARADNGVSASGSGVRAPIASGSAVARSDALERTKLSALHPLGVPLHAKPESGALNGRLGDGVEVVVEERSADGRWIKVRSSEGLSGWITRRYAPALKSQAVPAARLDPKSIWSSRAACEASVAAGQRAVRGVDTARIASWNLRWFPDGGPGVRPRAEGGTDVAWVACTLAWLDIDVVALQEIKKLKRAQAALLELTAALDRYTGGRWHARLDDCPDEAVQHVGLLYNEQHASPGPFLTLASLNPHGEACRDQLRPGLGARFRFRSGLDVAIVSVHMKSGGERRDFDLRRRSLEGIADVERQLVVDGDEDLVITGDFNTMGCRHCSHVVSAAEELGTLAKQVVALPVPLRVVPSSGGCSEYSGGRAALLDHFLVSSAMREVPPERHAVVSGLCSETACSELDQRAMPEAYRSLSDHCPAVLELDARDLD